MSLHRRAARRDDNEAAIVAALLAAGASVTYLSAPGCPDLLVGVDGRTLLVEVKRERGPRGGKRGGGRSRPGVGGDGELTADQLAWRAAWKGAPPVIVRTPEEAMRAIGAQDADRGDAAAVVSEVEAQTRSVTVLPGRIR